TWRTISGCMSSPSPAPDRGAVDAIRGQLHQKGIHEELDRPVRIAAEEIPAPDRVRALHRAADARIAARAVVDRFEEPRGAARAIGKTPVAGNVGEAEPLHRHLGVASGTGIRSGRTLLRIERPGEPAVRGQVREENAAGDLGGRDVVATTQSEP